MNKRFMLQVRQLLGSRKVLQFQQARGGVGEGGREKINSLWGVHVTQSSRKRIKYLLCDPQEDLSCSAAGEAQSLP